jgi:hypothetical protein
MLPIIEKYLTPGEKDYWKNVTFASFKQAYDRQEPMDHYSENNVRLLRWKYNFKIKLDELQKQRNSKCLWELENQQRHKFNTEKDSSTLLYAASEHSYGSNVDIYEYGKGGMEFIFQNATQRSVKALPACEDYFYRDWSRDGICVKNTDIFIKRAFATISPESVRHGALENAGMIDADEGLPMPDESDAARYLNNQGALNFSGCPPGTWYESDFESNPDDELREQTSYHIHNATPAQEIAIFKKLNPNWHRICGDI